MTKQEALTRVVLHARRQGERALGAKGYCVLWNAEGKRCFLGCLLTEKDAMTAAEVGTATTDVVEHLGLEGDFAEALVKVHDQVEPRIWEMELRRLANRSGLEMPQLADTAD